MSELAAQTSEIDPISTYTHRVRRSLRSLRETIQFPGATHVVLPKTLGAYGKRSVEDAELEQLVYTTRPRTAEGIRREKIGEALAAVSVGPRRITDIDWAHAMLIMEPELERPEEFQNVASVLSMPHSLLYPRCKETAGVVAIVNFFMHDESGLARTSNGSTVVFPSVVTTSAILPEVVGILDRYLPSGRLYDPAAWIPAYSVDPRTVESEFGVRPQGINASL